MGATTRDTMLSAIPQELRERFPDAEWVSVGTQREAFKNGPLMGFQVEAIIDGQRRRAEIRISQRSETTHEGYVADLIRQLEAPERP